MGAGLRGFLMRGRKDTKVFGMRQQRNGLNIISSLRWSRALIREWGSLAKALRLWRMRCLCLKIVFRVRQEERLSEPEILLFLPHWRWGGRRRYA
jgi:hypothetical protein